MRRESRLGRLQLRHKINCKSRLTKCYMQTYCECVIFMPAAGTATTTAATTTTARQAAGQRWTADRQTDRSNCSGSSHRAMEAKQNVCNKLSHFCRRPPKYQTWLIQQRQQQQRQQQQHPTTVGITTTPTTNNNNKVKMSCAVGEKYKKNLK